MHRKLSVPFMVGQPAGLTDLIVSVENSVPTWAATILDVEKIMFTAPKVAGQANLLLLQGEQNIHHVRVDHLRTSAEARKRIGGVFNLTASLAPVIESKPNAYSSARECWNW